MFFEKKWVNYVDRNLIMLGEYPNKSLCFGNTLVRYAVKRF